MKNPDVKKPELPVSLEDIQSLVEYYALTRNVGHTAAASQGLPANAIYLAATADQARLLKVNMWADVFPFRNVNRLLRGRHVPLVIDHAVIADICLTALRLQKYSDQVLAKLEEAKGEIERLTEQNEILTIDKNRLTAQVVNLCNELRTAKEEIEQWKGAAQERSMNTDTDSVVYFIKRNGIEAAGTVKYSSGEFHSDEFDFATDSPSQSGSIRQLSEWMTSMEAEGYKFLSVEELIGSL